MFYNKEIQKEIFLIKFEHTRMYDVKKLLGDIKKIGIDSSKLEEYMKKNKIKYDFTPVWTSKELGRKERRLVPYIISILCYFGCFFFMEYRNTPRVISIILVAALVIQMICAFINIWWKISTHMAAIGGVAGAMIIYSIAFSFNPLWWLSIVILLAGMVGSARMILRQHSLSQVVVGFFVGLICAFFVI